MKNKATKLITVIIAGVTLCCTIFYCIQKGEVIVEENIGNTTSEKTSMTVEQTLSLANSLVEEATATEAKTITVTSNQTITITESGIYELTGTAENAQLEIDTDGTVTILLNNVTMTNTSDSVINVVDAKQVLIYSLANTENTFISGEETEIATLEEDVSGAVIYSKDNLVLAGEGTTHVYGYINNGIASTDNLVILSGTYDIKAMNHGIKGKDNLIIEDGTIAIESGKDGLKASDSDSGNITIYHGTITINCLTDGISAENTLLVEDGNITINTKDYEASEISTIAESGFSQTFHGGTNFSFTGPSDKEDTTSGATVDSNESESNFTPPSLSDQDDATSGATTKNERSEPDFSTESTEKMMPSSSKPQDAGQFSNNTSSSDNEDSSKGLKAGTSITINNGAITITTKDDAIHSNGDVTINGGTITVATDDDGIHADEVLTINDGILTVSTSYEAIEGNKIYVTGGAITTNSSDDGINAGGTSGCVLKITGGTVTVNANGDGLDSNGDVILEGGNITVFGPTNSSNGALDSGTENGGQLTVSGGELIAIGASGMDESFSSNSSQCSFRIVTSTYSSDTEIMILDEQNNVLYSVTSPKSFSSIVYTSNQLQENGTYTVQINDDIYTVTLDGVYGSNSSSSNNFSNGFGKRRG